MPEPRYQSGKALAANFEVGADAGRRRYTTSKLCNIYDTYELAKRLGESSDARLRSLRVNAFDPVMMPGTGLARTYPAPLRLVWNYILPVATWFHRNINRASTSGARLAKLARGEMGNATGKYYSVGRETWSSALSYSTDNAHELWNTSADMTGLSHDLASQQG